MHLKTNYNKDYDLRMELGVNWDKQKIELAVIRRDHHSEGSQMHIYPASDFKGAIEKFNELDRVLE